MAARVIGGKAEGRMQKDESSREVETSPAPATTPLPVSQLGDWFALGDSCNAPRSGHKSGRSRMEVVMVRWPR